MPIFKPTATLSNPKVHVERNGAFYWRLYGHWDQTVIINNGSPPPAKLRRAATKSDVTT